MTLTEEQRGAIRAISKLPMAIGCQLCHPYIMKNYGSHFIVLRAMIDSSDHIVGPDELIGFDLERARGLRDFLQDDCAEVGDVWAEMIAEIERLRAALAESEKVVEHKGKSATHWYDEHLRAQTDLTQSKRVIEQQVARIKELESAWEELCDRIQAEATEAQKWKERSMKLEAALIEKQTHLEPSAPSCYRAARRNSAIETLRAEGLIGPDADECPDDLPPIGSPYRSWQITKERKAALEHILICHHCRYDDSGCKAPDVLRAMLEAGQ